MVFIGRAVTELVGPDDQIDAADQPDAAVSPGTVRPTAAGRAREVGDSDRLATRRGDDDPPPGIQVPRSKGSELAGLSGGDHAEPGQLARR